MTRVAEAAALTDAAVSDDPVLVVALLPVGDLNDAVAAVAFVVGGVFHGLERRQLEWKHLWRNPPPPKKRVASLLSVHQT